MLHASQIRTDWRGLARAAVGAVVLAGVAAMAAPAAFGQSISFSRLESIYNPGEVGYAADDRDLKVVVRGNPFASHGVTDRQLANAVVDSMRGSPGWFVTNYTTTPNDTARELYRVVWLIGVDQGTSLYAICGGVPGGISIGGYTIGGSESGTYDENTPLEPGRTVLAALCRRERMMSYLSGTLGDIASIEDPRFRDLIKVATRQLFPLRDPNRDGGGRDDFDS